MADNTLSGSLRSRLLRSVSRSIEWRSAKPGLKLVAFFIILGFVARFRLFFENHAFWYDEAYLLLDMMHRSFGGLVGASDHNIVAPVGYLWIQRTIYLLTGGPEWAMRLPAFLAGAAALILMVPLAHRVAGGGFAWLPAALLATSRHASSHGCEVRTYTLDILFSILILQCLSLRFGIDSSTRGRRTAILGLLVCAVIAPWLSFPSAFSLGGAIVAITLNAVRTRNGKALGFSALFFALVALSGFTLWYFHARNIPTGGLVEHWGHLGWGGFPDWESPASLALWPIKAWIGVGNYGTREMGAVFLILGGFGIRRLARLQPQIAIAIASTSLLALVASYLGKYPIADRTVMFLLPGVWLASAAGIAEIAERVPGRRWPYLLPIAVLAFDLITFGQSVIAPPRYPETREAYSHVQSRRWEHDIVWISHAEVYRVYHGDDAGVVAGTSSPDAVLARAAGRRVWLVDQPTREFSMATGIVRSLEQSGYAEENRRDFHGVVVRLMTKP